MLNKIKDFNELTIIPRRSKPSQIKKNNIIVINATQRKVIDLFFVIFFERIYKS